MKQQNSPEDIRDRIAEDMDYTTHPSTAFPYATLKEAADAVGITPQRMSRVLRVMQILVYRIGHLILLDDEAVKAVQEAISNKLIRPGPKSKKKDAA